MSPGSRVRHERRRVEATHEAVFPPDLASTPDGVALYWRPHKGFEAELTCLRQVVEKLQSCPSGLIIVADSAFGHLLSLCEADRQGLRFVVPLRHRLGRPVRRRRPGRLKALADLAHVAERERHLPPKRRTRRRGLLPPFPTTEPKHTNIRHVQVAYIWSSEEAACVAEARERALRRLRPT